MTLGNRLYEMRKEKGLSQEKTAEVLGVTRQTISKWETDQSTPDFDKILPLCELYGISTEELLTGKKQENCSTDNTDSCNDSTVNNKYNYDNQYSYYSDTAQNDDINNEINDKTANGRKRFAILTSIAVCMYILSVVPPIVFDGSDISTAAFFVIIALATMLIVFGALSKPKRHVNNEYENVMTGQKRLYKQITGILSGITLCIYLTISFLTSRWDMTWIIWIIYGIVCKIVDLVLTLKESDKDGEK
ncbi:MAG: helix-turn-helix domain-containing protein [Eubacterium sp.]|nr:helix-turn-helix domain-containing protein [Eubacterium sp.]